MINYLLYSLDKDKLSKDQKWFFFGFLATLSLIVISFVGLFSSLRTQPKSVIIFETILVIIGFILFAIVLYLVEQHTKTSVDIDYQKYNAKLDKLRDILKSAEYNMPVSNAGSSSARVNWYTKDKLKYLIKEFRKLSSPKTRYDYPELKSLKYALIPIVSFVGGVIAEKANLKISISVAFIAAVTVLVFWSIFQLIKEFSELISFYTSERQAKRIYSLLSDLYIRDFDDSIPSQDDTTTSQTNNNP